NTVYKHRYILADNTFVFDEKDYFLSWDNELIDDYSVRILLDFFVYNGSSYDRYSEEFTETAFETEDLSASLNPYFDVLGIYNDLSLDEPKEDSERLYFVCKRKK
ncbi:MAG: class I SAM-dependent methyltransferase, partial [Eubacterium sp.]|nr:class I SAM-dependent methyltransferase [Eubacterium sp.]